MLHKTVLALTAAATIGVASLPATEASAWSRGWDHSHYSWHYRWHRHYAWYGHYGWHRHYGWYHHWHGRRA